MAKGDWRAHGHMQCISPANEAARAQAHTGSNDDIPDTGGSYRPCYAPIDVAAVKVLTAQIGSNGFRECSIMSSQIGRGRTTNGRRGKDGGDEDRGGGPSRSGRVKGWPFNVTMGTPMGSSAPIVLAFHPSPTCTHSSSGPMCLSRRQREWLAPMHPRWPFPLLPGNPSSRLPQVKVQSLLPSAEMSAARTDVPDEAPTGTLGRSVSVVGCTYVECRCACWASIIPPSFCVGNLVWGGFGVTWWARLPRHLFRGRWHLLCVCGLPQPSRLCLWRS